MIRFIMPDAAMDKAYRIKHIDQQFEEFLTADAFRRYLEILDIEYTSIREIYDALEAYNTRKGTDGQIRESQVAPLNEVLEKNRYNLYPIYRELGLLDINKPRTNDYNHIVLLGGSANSNFDKTLAAKKLITDKVVDVSALASFRPIPPGELKKMSSDRKGGYETEFGSFDAAFNRAFNLIECEDDGKNKPYDFPRNINQAHRIKTYKDTNGRTYRVFASPSLNPEERAGTYDTCVHYMKTFACNEKAKILVITNNQYCNYQFIPFMLSILENDKCMVDLDIIGCSDDDNLASEKEYNSNQYYGDIRSMIEWIMKFKKQFVK